jgi:Protein of unknown function (DUF2442)
MIEIVNVTKVEVLGNFQLRVKFSDGTTGIHDFRDIVEETGPMVEPLRNQDIFNRVFVSMGVLTWPNGFDVDAIQLQREMRSAGELTANAAE